MSLYFDDRPGDFTKIFTSGLLSLRQLRVYEIATYTGESHKVYRPTLRRQLVETDAELARRGYSL